MKNKRSLSKYQIKNLSFIFVLALFSLDVGAEQSSQDPYAEAGQRITDILNANDVEGFYAAFDYDSFAHRIGKNLYTTKKQIRDYTKELKSVQPKQVMVNQLMTHMVGFEGVKVKFIRVLDKTRLLVRLSFPDNEGYQYIIFSTRPDRGKGIEIIDIFSLSLGRYISKNISMSTQIFADSNDSFLEQAFGAITKQKTVRDKLRGIAKLITAQKHEESYWAILNLPNEIRDSRIMVDHAVNFSQYVSEEEYDKQLTRLHKLFGDDPGSAFMLIDYQMLNEDYDEGLRLVQTTKSFIGNDGVLESLKASFLYLNGDYRAGIKSARLAVELEQDLEFARDALIMNLLANGSFEDTVTEYKALESDFGYQFEQSDFADNADYRELTKSEPFKKWMGIQ